MATYRGRLEEGRRFKGVQVTLYKPEGDKLDATTSDKDGFYSFTGLKTGIYHLRFEGRDFDPAKYQVIFVAEDGSNIIYYIRANNGTTIKNSTGTLSLDLIELKNGVYTNVTQGSVKLYYKTGPSSYALLSSLGGVTATDYSASEILATAFSDKLEVVAIKDFGIADQFIIDGITLLNLSDGAQGPGILYIGEWADIASNRELNNNPLAVDVVSLSGTYYAWRGPDVTLKSDASSPMTGLPDWEEFEYFSAIATGLLIAEKSYIKESVNIGTNPEGTAANITIWGGDTNPYISIGQPAGDIGYNELGIWAGTSSGVAKLSMKSGSGSLLWDGTNLDVTGRIFAQAGGTIAGWDIGTDSISKNGVYLSSVVGEGGLYVNDSGTKRLQIGDFATISPTETNVWQGTLSSSNSSVAGTIAVGTSGGVSESTEVTFTFITSTTGYSEAYAILNIPNIVSGGTVSISFDLESPTYLPDYMGGGLWPTYKPQLIVEGSYNSGAVNIPELYIFHTSSNWYPTTTKHLVSFNNTGSLLSNSRIKFTAKAKFTSAGGVVWKIKNLKVYNSIPKANFTKDQVLLYVSPQNYLQWTKSALTLKGGNLDVGAISAGSVLISGDLIVQGETIISGELSSHPTISAAASVNNSNGSVIQDLTFDPFGHVTAVTSTDLDSRYVKLSQASQSITGDLTITGNVTISGGLTTVDTTTVTTSDNLIIINNGEVGAGVTAGTAGIQVDRGSLTDYQFMFRETDDSFVIGEIGSLQKVATREDTPISAGVPFFNAGQYRFDTASGFTFDGTNLLLPNQATASTHAVRADRTISLTGTANQVTVTGTTAQALTGNVAWTLSLPQNIDTNANVRFQGLGINNVPDANIGRARFYENSAITAVGIQQAGAGNIVVLYDGTTARLTVDGDGLVSMGQGLSAQNVLNLNNNNIVNVNNITFSDPGPDEGLSWLTGSLWKIYESPNDLVTNSAGNLQIVQGTTRRATFNTSGQLEVPIATGTSPILVNSTTLVTNLNADLWDGYQFSSYLNQAVLTSSSPDFTALRLTGGNLVIKNGTYALHFTASDDSIRSYVLGDHDGETTSDYISVGSQYGQVRLTTGPAGSPTTRLLVNISGRISIGNTNDTHNFDVTGTGRFSGVITSTVTTGTAPFTIASTTQIANLNADLWDGYQFADYLNQDVKSSASPTFVNVTLSGTTASRLLSTNGSKVATSVSDLTAWIAGTTNQITSTSNGDGSLTLSLPQNIDTGAAVQFGTLTLNSANSDSVLLGATGSYPGGVALWNRSTTGGWARGLIMRSSGGTTQGGFGFLGDGASFTGLYIGYSGTWWTSYAIAIGSDNKVVLGSQATGTTHAVRADRSLTMTGTTNQINVSAGAQNLILDRTWTFSLPQDIHNAATPTFGGLTINGNVGITGTTTVTGILNIDNIRLDGNTVSITDTNGNLILSPNGIGYTYITSKLGVNTIPNYRIHALDGTVAEFVFNSGLSALTPTIAVGNTDVNGKFAALTAGTVGAAFTYDSSGVFIIASEAKANYTSGSLGSGTERLRISSTGNVSIGNTNNTYKLDVSGTGRFTLALQLDTQATAANHAVAGARALALNVGNSLSRTVGAASQTLAGDVSWTLDTIQDIRTTATPTFAGGTFTGQVSVTSATFPPLYVTRTSSVTNSAAGVLAVRHSTSADMVDTFAAGISFFLKDSSAIDYEIARISGSRAGADNTGDFIIEPFNAGTAVPNALVVRSTNKVSINTLQIGITDVLDSNRVLSNITQATIDNIGIDGNTISTSTGNLTLAPVAGGQVIIPSNGQTIAGTTYANGWLAIGTSNGIVLDDNEIVKFGGALNITVNGAFGLTFTTNASARFAISSAGVADFYGNSLNNVGTANIDEARIGDNAITAWEATSPFVGATAPLNIYTTVGTAPYQRMLVMRNNNNFSATGLRRLGVSWHLSSEGSAAESNKMGAITLESSNTFSNTPDLKLWTANKARLIVNSYGQVLINNLDSGTYHTLQLVRNTGAATIKGITGGTDTNGEMIIDGSDNANGDLYLNQYVGRKTFINAGASKGVVFIRTVSTTETADVKLASQVLIETEASKTPFLHLRSDGTDTYGPQLYFYKNAISGTTPNRDTGFRFKYNANTDRFDLVSVSDSIAQYTVLSAGISGGRIGMRAQPDSAWGIFLAGSTIINNNIGLTGSNAIAFGVAGGNTAVNTLPGWYASDTTWVRNLNSLGVYLTGTTGNLGAMVAENWIGSSTSVSGPFGTGWKIWQVPTGESFMEIDNIRVRNEMRVHIFKKDVVKVANGYLYIANADVLSEDVAVPASGTFTIYTTENALEVGDLVWAKDIQESTGLVVAGVKAEVTTAVGSTTRNNLTVYQYTLTLTSGGSVTLNKGVTLAVVGSTSNTGRQGGIFFDASSSDSPYMDIYSGVNSWAAFSASAKTKARLGVLSGIVSPTFGKLGGEGLWTNNIYLEGNAAIAGTLTAGDAVGFGNTFYAGRLYKNIISHSNNFSDAVWTKTTGSITATNVTAPDGTATASTFTSSSSDGILLRNVTLVANTTYTFSGWIKGTGIGSVRISISKSDWSELTSSTFVYDTTWKRFSISGSITTTGGRIAIGGGSSLTNTEAIDIAFAQLELGSIATPYQPTDGTVSNTSGYGMWSVAGGFGGTMQAPVVSLNNYGLRIEAGRGTATAMIANSIMLGNITGAQTGVKITMTGTNSTSGIFGYNGTNETTNLAFALRVDGTAQIAGFSFGPADMWAGNAVIGSATVVINTSTPKIALGATANAITHSNTSAGFYVDGAGNFKISDGTNYIRMTGGALTTVTSNYTLSSGKTSAADTANAGLWISGADFYVGTASDASYIKYVSGALSLAASSFDLKGGTTLNITQTKVALGTAASSRTATTATAGAFIGQDGTFGFYIDADNYVRSNSGLQVASSNFDLKGSTTLHMTTTKLAFGTSAQSRTATTASTGIYLDQAGDFGLWIDADNYLRKNSGNLEFASESLTIRSGKTSLADAVTAGMYINTTGFKFGTANDATYIWWDGSALSFKATNATMTTAGNITASNVDLTGIIKADAGWFGGAAGWTISTGLIASATTGARIAADGSSQYISFGATPPTTYGNNVGVWLGNSSGGKVSIYADASNYFQWDGAKLLIKGANFTLDAFGNLTATSATLSGAVTADTGYIGGSSGWVIAANKLTTNSGTNYIAGGVAIAPTAYNTDGTGFYIGGTGLFRVGTFTTTGTVLTKGIAFDGSDLAISATNFTLTTAGNVTVTGVINATGGNFTNNVTVGTAANKITLAATGTDTTTAIYSKTGTYGAAGNGFWMDASGRFGLGDKLTWDGATLSVTGAITATSGTFTGTVQATAGYIGGAVNGWTIGTGTITAAGTGKILIGTMAFGNDVSGSNDGLFINATNYVYVTPGVTFKWGSTNSYITGTDSTFNIVVGTSDTFSLSAANLSIVSGAANVAKIEVGASTNVGGINSAAAAGDVVFWAGLAHSNRATAPFRVLASGALVATSATITGDITATSGTFTGTVNANAGTFSSTVYVGATSNRIVIDGTNKLLKSESYVASTSGWAINGNGTIDFRGGNIAGWTITASALHNATGTIDGTTYTTTGLVLGSTGFIATPKFRVTTGGILYAVEANISGAITATSGSFTGTINASGGVFTGNVTAGTSKFGVDVSSSNDGIWLNANNYAYDSGNFKWGTATSYVTNSGGAFSLVVGGSDILTLTATSNTSYLALGGATALGSGTGIWIDGAGNFRAGNPSGNKLEWSSSTLTVSGVVNITGASTFTGNISVTSGNITLSSAGQVVAGSTTLGASGITANQGTVGGWTLAAGSLTGGNAVLANTGILTLGTGNDVAVVSAADLTYRFWAGHATPANAPFSVTKAGAVKAESGTMAGWNLSSTTINKNGVYLSSVANEGGLYIQEGSSKRLQVGDFADVATTETNVWQGTYTSENENVSGVLPVASIGSGESAYIQFTYISSGAGYAEGWARLTLPDIPDGGTVEISFDLEQPIYIPTYMSTGWPTYKPQFYLTTTYDSGVTEIADLTTFYTPSDGNWYPTTNKVKLTYVNTSGVTRTNVRTEFKAKLKYTSTGAAGWNVKNIKIYNVFSKVNLTKEQVLLYVSPSNYLEWTKSSLTLKGGQLDVGPMSAGDTEIFGNLIVRGETTITGNLASHPNVVGAADATLSGATVLSTVDFDTWGHITAYTTRSMTPADIGAVSTTTTLQISSGTGITGGGAAVDLSSNRSWTIGLTGQALALHNLGTNGIIVRTGSGTVAARSIAVSGTGLSVSNADGVSGNPTITSNATNLNTVSTIVARDGSGNFTAGTITAALSGNATTATTLQNSRTIWGQSFNGGANVTGDLTLNAHLIGASSVRVSGLSSSWGVTTNITTTGFTVTMGTSTSATWLVAGHSSGTFRGGWQLLDSGTESRFYTNANFFSTSIGTGTTLNLGNLTTVTATTFSGALSGNATTATTLQNARTIAISGPVTGTATSFNGSANITIPVTALDVSHANVTGTMAVDHGGTGVATLGANQVMYGNGTSAVQTSANLTFNGTVLTINGTLEATEKSFNIAHPTQPGKRLVYGVLEGPEHAVYVRGTINGSVIELPEEWVGLVDADTITVQLTPRDSHQKLYIKEVKDNKVHIGNSNMVDKRVYADYLIMGTRKDVAKLKTVRDVV